MHNNFLSALWNRKGFKDWRSYHWYNFLSLFAKNEDVTFMNYGFVDPQAEFSLDLEPEDEKNRNCIGLYHVVASAVETADRDVLEISSGRGGGASYICRYLQPASYTGVDRTKKAVEWCRKNHVREGLRFELGDAQQLPFEPESFNVVINVEASHCYPDFQAFLSEVKRVLKPGGHFLYADFRNAEDVQPWLSDLAAAGFKKIEEQDITAEVLLSMAGNSERYKRIVDKVTPRIARPRAYRFAGIKGYGTYNAFERRERIYMRFVLQKT